MRSLHGLCLFLWCSTLLWQLIVSSQRGEYRGCFVDVENLRDLPYGALETDAHTNVDKCIDACLKKYYMFSGLQGGQRCFCGSSFGKYGTGNCTIRCSGNSTQFCGGINANSIYLTGFATAGPPANVTLIQAKEHSLVIRWLPPLASNGIIMQYKVSAKLVNSHLDGTPDVNSYLQWSFSNTTIEAELPGMIPATLYNITVLAASGLGDGLPFNASFWTDISEPDRPPVAEILRKEGSQMTIQLPDVPPTKGPISSYQVVIYDEASNFPLDPNRFYNYNEAKSQNLPFYIAAELQPQQARTNFIVGDGGQYNGYYNAPLSDDNSHTVVVGVVSRLNGRSKAAYSVPASFKLKSAADAATVTRAPEVVAAPPLDGQPGFAGEVYEGHDMRPQEDYVDSTLVTGLGVAVGIGAVLLIASVVVYFLIRRHYGQRRQSDHQELTVQSTSEMSDNGIVSSIMVMEDERDVEFLYDSLKDRFWHIPQSNLDVSDELIGYGKYGPVKKGVANRKNSQIPVTIQVTKAHAGDSDRERRNFVNDLDTLIRIGSHTNIISLVGGCEIGAALYVCTEWYSGSLKSFLLDSRTMEHYPVYAERQHRASTLKELQLLEIALGIARGMAHLAHNKVIHRRLTAYSVLIVDEVIAKVTDFGVTQVDRNPPFDSTRWLAVESLKNRTYTSKSDVWMFGVVLWEIVTLGATPYANIKTRDVPGRVMRGARLPQPRNTGDDLYQIMLQCWQIDPDERSSFNELSTIFGKMLTEDVDKDFLNLNLYPGFQYEKYENELEVVSQVTNE
ncbi:hypothetical protein CHUAL_009366 [Chamberlinius hualienensis]